jgi:hypothetical protein
MMTQEQIQQEINCFKSTKRLTTHPYLICTATGEKVMAFGQMLEKKIDRYGGLENMLKTFVSRKAKSASKPQKVSKPKKVKKTKLLEKTEDQRYDIPIFKNEPHTSLSLREHPEHTKGACLRPDIFLDSDRTCDYCSMNSYCLANNKTFSKKYNYK